jgi:hypothetical protein
MPMGLVNSCVIQFVGAQARTEGDEGVEELMKKQKRSSNNTTARSAAVAGGSPHRAQ